MNLRNNVELSGIETLRIIIKTMKKIMRIRRKKMRVTLNKFFSGLNYLVTSKCPVI